MSDRVAAFNGQIMTRREVEIAREAFVRARMMSLFSIGGDAELRRSVERAAAETYPFPTVTRPRVLSWEGGSEVQYLVGRGFQYRLSANHKWEPLDGSWNATPERVRVLGNLLDKPTVEVEE